MNLAPDVVVFMVGQVIAILFGIAVSHIKTREQIVELKTRLDSLEIHYEAGLASISRDHHALSTRVDGISRAVANIEGRLSSSNLDPQ